MNKWLKFLSIIAISLITVILIAIGTIYLVTNNLFAQKYNVTADNLTVSATPEVIQRGKHLVTAIGKCADCHGDDLGGKVVIDDPAFGKIYASNLTAGNGGKAGLYTDATLAHAIRYGIAHDNRGLFFMPSLEYYHFNDEDIAAIVAYLRTLPKVDRVMPVSNPGPLGRALYLAGKVPMLVPASSTINFAPRGPSVPIGPTKEYGTYLATVGGCVGCHGEKLTGGPIPGAPPDWPKAANITPTPAGIGSWTEADFMRVLRTGTRPDGRVLSAVMPWPYTKNMTDLEIKAVWEYLRSL